MNSLNVFAVTIVVLVCASSAMASPRFSAGRYCLAMIGPHCAALVTSLSRFYQASHRADLGVA
jgi:hypothetical protein